MGNVVATGRYLLAKVNSPRPTLVNRDSFPRWRICRSSEAYNVASGVFPPGLDQYPFANIVSTIALQVIGSFASTSTLSAAAIWLSFSAAGADAAAGLVAALGLAFTLGAGLVFILVFGFVLVAIRSLSFQVLVRSPGNNHLACETSYLTGHRTSSHRNESSKCPYGYWYFDSYGFDTWRSLS